MAIAELLLAPVMAPLWGVRFVLARLRDEADAVQHDERRTFAALAELSRRRHTGEISEAELEQEEAELLERLRSIRKHQDESLGHELDGDDGWVDAEDAEVVEEE